LEIEVAKSYGFCFGVKRAIKIAEENPGSSTLGPLIHNNMEIERLKRDFNVSLATTLDDVAPGGATVIRTHGIPKGDLKRLKEKGGMVIDATCPFVTKPQQIVEQMSDEGYDIVIFGDVNHPEIKGVMSYASGPVYAILGVDEVSRLHLKERVALVAQTTRKIEEYNKRGARIQHYLQRHIRKSGCRQRACAEGGYHDSGGWKAVIQYQAALLDLQIVLRRLLPYRE